MSVAEYKDQNAQSNGNVRQGAGSAAVTSGSSGPDGKTLGGGLAKPQWFGRQPPTAPRAMREGLRPRGGISSSRSSIGRGHPGFHTWTALKIERTQSTASLGLKFEHRPARKTGNAGGRSTGPRKRQHSSSRGSQGGSTVSQLPAKKRRHIDEPGQSVGGALQGVNA
jgi:hypothetical protein